MVKETKVRCVNSRQLPAQNQQINTRKDCDIGSKPTIKAPEWHH